MLRHWTKHPIVFAILLLLAACGRTQTEVPLDLALRIEEQGLYELSTSDLSTWGWDLDSLMTEQIELSWGDQPVPFDLHGKGKERRLRFYGHIEPSRYADYSLYRLRSVNEGQGTGVPVRLVTASEGRPELQVPYSQHIESNTTYLTQAAESEPWLGDRIFAPGEISLPLDVQDYAGGAALLTLQLWSASEAPVDPDHHMIIKLNDTNLGDINWDGMGMKTFSLEIAEDVLVEGKNQLALMAPGDTGSRAELVYLDWLELAYSRFLQADQDRLSFTGAGSSYELSGFSGDAIELWDVTDPSLPSRLEGYNVMQEDGLYRLQFTDDTAENRDYVAASDEGYLKPGILSAAQPLVLPPEGADYIVILAESLQAEAIEPLIAHRQAQGLRTTVVSTQQIWDRFSRGVPSAEAISDFLRWAVSEWPAPAPRFVLLAGDASYDPLNYLGDSSANLIPTKFISTLEMGETASDNALADLDNDGLPDLAIGRLPVQTTEQLQAMVQKILDYEQAGPSGEWLQRMLFVADDDDPFFHSFNTQMQAAIPTGYKTEELVIDEGELETRSQFLQALNAGQWLVSYMGHGAVNIWAQEEILTNQDIPELEQQGRLPFVVVWACLSGFFHHPQVESLGETLVLSEDKGAIAALVPTGQTFATDQHVMADALFNRHLFTAQTIGDALLASFRELNPERLGQRDIINTFVLLGDPALRLLSGAGD